MTSSAKSEPALRAEGVHVAFGDTEIIRGVGFSVAPGEKVGVVGESGSGKSTLALAAMGLLAPGGRITQGSISIAGRHVDYSDERALNRTRGRDLSLVFQDPLTSLDPVKSIGNQIGEAVRWHNPRMPRRQIAARAVELLTAVGVPDPESRLHQYPHEFSGGMRQRVLIAIAIANDPAVLIADEPTTALDVTTQAQVLELLNRLVDDLGIAVVLVTHDIGVVSEFCDRVLVMYSGRVVEQISTEDMFTGAAHPYTSALLASLPRRGMGRDAELSWIPGAPPPMTNLPTGCAFAPRCGWVVDRCAQQPTPVAVGAAGHQAECHRAEDVRAHHIRGAEEADHV